MFQQTTSPGATAAAHNAARRRRGKHFKKASRDAEVILNAFAETIANNACREAERGEAYTVPELTRRRYRYYQERYFGFRNAYWGY